MQAQGVERFSSGMDVFDATGERIGRVTAVAVRLRPVAGSPDPSAPCPEEVMLDVHTNGFLGLGPRVDVPVTEVDRVEGHCVFLRRPVRELRRRL